MRLVQLEGCSLESSRRLQRNLASPVQGSSLRESGYSTKQVYFYTRSLLSLPG